MLEKLEKVSGLEILLDFRDSVHFNPTLHKKFSSILLYSARSFSAPPAL